MNEQTSQCWSEIGVWSPLPPTCPVLERVIHCRNCEVYTKHGRTLLERAIPAALKDEWTRNVARPINTKGSLSESYLIFRLGDDHFALPTLLFEEVISTRPIHSIPHKTGKVVLGFVAFRGRLELCVSLSNLLGADGVESDTESAQEQKLLNSKRILVIHTGEEIRYLFPVSAVLGTHRYELEGAAANWSSGSVKVFAYLQGMFTYQGKNVGVIDQALLLEALGKSLLAR